MRSQWITLLKVQLWSRLRINDLKARDSGKKRRNAVILAVSIVLLAFMLCCYSFAMSYGLGYMGMAALIPAYALVITAVLSFFFTMLKTNGVLFGFRDYDMLMSLPIKTTTVIASRFFTMYFMNMLITVLIMIPMGIGYVYWANPQVGFYPLWLIGMLAAPLIPTILATLAGALIMALASRFRYANGASIFLSFALIIGVLLLSFSGGMLDSSSFTMINMANISELVYQQIDAIYPAAGLFSSAVTQNNWGSMGIFLIISVGLYCLFIKLLSIRYGAINSALKGHLTRSDYKIGALKTASPLKALYRKELKRFFTTMVYITNMGVGVIMEVMIVVACVAVGPVKIEELLQIPGFTQIYTKMLPFAVSALLAMSCTTCASLSLEGKNIWILKSSPLKPKTIFDSKILVNLTLLLPVSFFSSIALSIHVKPDFFTVLLYFAVPLVYSVFISVFGMYLNIRMPNYEWESETVVVKQNLCSLMGILGGLLAPVLGIGILFLSAPWDYRIVSAGIVAVMGLISGFLYQRIKGSKIN